MALLDPVQLKGITPTGEVKAPPSTSPSRRISVNYQIQSCSRKLHGQGCGCKFFAPSDVAGQYICWFCGAVYRAVEESESEGK